MPQGINTTELAANLGDFCREDSGIVSRQLMAQFELDGYAAGRHVTDQSVELSLLVDSIVKPRVSGSNDWTPTNDAITFRSRILQTRSIKVDLEVVPDILYSTFLAQQQVRKNNGLQPFPFEQFIMEDIARRAVDDIITKAVWQGVYNPSGTTPNDAFDGFVKLIGDEITAGTITPSVTGALTTSNAVEAFELVYSDMVASNELMSGVETVLLCSPSAYGKYLQDYRGQFGSLPYNTEFKKPTLDVAHSKCTIMPVVGTGEGDFIVITPKNNFTYGYDMTDPRSVMSFRVQWDKRAILVIGDGKFGVGIADPRLVFTNDAA